VEGKDVQKKVQATEDVDEMITRFVEELDEEKFPFLRWTKLDRHGLFHGNYTRVFFAVLYLIYPENSKKKTPN
jgi:hypothetical protein